MRRLGCCAVTSLPERRVSCRGIHNEENLMNMFLSWGTRPSHRDKTTQHTDIMESTFSFTGSRLYFFSMT